MKYRRRATNRAGSASDDHLAELRRALSDLDKDLAAAVTGNLFGHLRSRLGSVPPEVVRRLDQALGVSLTEQYLDLLGQATTALRGKSAASEVACILGAYAGRADPVAMDELLTPAQNFAKYGTDRSGDRHRAARAGARR